MLTGSAFGTRRYQRVAEYRAIAVSNMVTTFPAAESHECAVGMLDRVGRLEYADKAALACEAILFANLAHFLAIASMDEVQS
jgi:hypothetical protein